MWAAGVGFSIERDAALAGREAAAQAGAAAGGADAAFVFAGPIHRGAARELVATVRAELGTSRIGPTRNAVLPTRGPPFHTSITGFRPRVGAVQPSPSVVMPGGNGPGMVPSCSDMKSS